MRFHGIGDDERYLAVECCTTPHTTNALSLAGEIGQIRLACFDAWSTSLGHPMELYFRVAVASQYPAYGRGRSEYIFRHYEVLERFLPDENQVLALVAVPCSARGMAYEPSLLVPVYQCCRISGQPSEVQLRHKYKYPKRRCRHLDFRAASPAHHQPSWNSVRIARWTSVMSARIDLEEPPMPGAGPTNSSVGLRRRGLQWGRPVVLLPGSGCCQCAYIRSPVASLGYERRAYSQ